MLCQSSCIVCTQCGWIKSICGISVWNKLRVIRAFLTLPAFLHHRRLEHLHNVEQNNVTFLFQTLAVLTRQAGFAIQVQVQNSVVYVFFFKMFPPTHTQSLTAAKSFSLPRFISSSWMINLSSHHSTTGQGCKVEKGIFVPVDKPLQNALKQRGTWGNSYLQRWQILIFAYIF